ncbi:MAG: glycosyltransferase family 2 protein [Scytonematopsis contorta HA4267-MV1]|jgi:hypothetical protein|nr:glycosyltransferase family 2 protein [Scytonematopsis contorta HA4267-MV1]
MKTAIALIIFKRPDTTQKVFEVIRKVKPPKLFVIADAPRKEREGEVEKCEETRAIIDQVNWDCEVYKNYSDINLGCAKRIYSGLSWVFNHVEEAIIVEDDCILDSTFFQFSEELLERYRHDNRITSISAQNVQLGQKRTKYSYYFSRYSHCWGWATWRRAWQTFDFEMKLWEEAKYNNILDDVFTDSLAVSYWTNIFQNTYNRSLDSWAYRWLLSCWLQSGLTIIPDVNLVSNIGFNDDATNTQHKNNKTVEMEIESLEFPLNHPPVVVRNVQADNFAQRVAFDGGWLKQFHGSSKKLIKKVLCL